METEIVVIGAGVIGLSIARKLSCEGRSVVLLEKESGFGLGVSSRNTEVIHAGIYYKTGSLKAALCLKGRMLLYEHCKKYNIKHKKTGKLFIAVTEAEIRRLELTRAQALENGVSDCIEIGREKLREMEPAVNAVAGLFSPSSGILDSHAFMGSLLSSGRSAGLIFAAGSPVVGAERDGDDWVVRTGGREQDSIKCKVVVNAAGLDAIGLSKRVFPARPVPDSNPVKGCYVRYSGKSPISHIIYPAIVPGIIEERADATPDLAGSLRFGPSVEKTAGPEDFDLPPGLVGRMTPAIKRYLPGIDESRLHPDTCGIRPKIVNVQGGVEDFHIDWSPEPGWLDLWGIESPGLTASLAIADHVYGLIEKSDILCGLNVRGIR